MNLHAAAPIGTPMAMTGRAILAAADASQPQALRKFRLDAYNGGAMQFAWSDVPVVVDLTGLDLTEKARPILKEHDPLQVVGHSTAIVSTGAALTVDGIVSGAGAAAAEVVAAADRGFPWQASIGCQIVTTERIPAGVEAFVNGQNFTGPLLIVRTSRLGEVSFVALGADDSTAGRMIAAATTQTPGNTMDFAEWLTGLGFDPAALSPEQTAVLQKAYDAEVAASAAPPEQKPEAAKAARKALLTASAEVSRLEAAKVKPTAPAAGTDLQAARKAAADETRRIAEVRRLCAGAHADIEAKAIEEGWNAEKTELAVLRAGRSHSFAVHSGNQPASGDVLQAAILQATRHPKADEAFPDQVLQAAHTRFKGRIGLQELLLEAAQANGHSGLSFRQDPAGVLRAAFGQLQAGGFSTVNVPGILSNTANKFLLEGFQNVESAWREIAAIRAVNDFKTVTSYRMTGTDQYEKVGASGELKSGDLAEDSYSNKADTYGRLFSITRRDLINDDLGALSTVPKKLGRGAALKLNDVFWTEFLASVTSFYTTARKNYFEGAATNLQISSLTTAVQYFRDQTDADGKPLGISPALLVVPTALEVIAQNLFNGQNLVVGALGSTSSKSTEPNVNPHAGNYKPVVSAYLGNSSYTGYSSTAWYLVADPRDVPLIEVAFLNGQESPTVETADADFSTLGIQMRGYHDFGVAKQDYRAAVRSKGAA